MLGLADARLGEERGQVHRSCAELPGQGVSGRGPHDDDIAGAHLRGDTAG